MSTKNTKGNRKVVEAIYRVASVFMIPDDLDLEDKSVVKKWYVEHDILYIYYVDGKEEEIEPYMDYQGCNYERPSETLIVDEDSFGGGILYEDEDKD